MCDCVKIINAQLASQNTRIKEAIQIVNDGDPVGVVLIETEKILPKLRKHVSLSATFCPFCGIKPGAQVSTGGGYPQCDGEDSYE